LNGIVALLASVTIVFGSPYAGQLRGALQSSFPDQYRWIVGGVVAIAALAAIVSAVGRLRQTRPLESSTTDRGSTRALRLRYGLIVLAVTMSAIYASVVRSGNPDVDVVEAFHFVEYGLVAYLFYRVWRSRPDLSGVVFAACAGLAVGVADEWVQWFVPGRVGEIHDVALNTVALGCSLLFSMAVRPPSSLNVPPSARSRLALGAALSGLIIAVAGFVDRVHLGYEVNDSQVGIFRSQYDARALAAAAASRPARWHASPPPVGGFRREDH
jgi:VanZ family protein